MREGYKQTQHSPNSVANFSGPNPKDKRGDKENFFIPIEKISSVIEKVSQKTNEYVLEKFKIKNLLNPDGTVRIEEYEKSKGGPYTEFNIQFNKEETERLEQKFADKEGVSIKIWHKNKQESKGNKVEALTMILLNRILKEKFLVMRSASIDDYKFGVDYIIVNPETGEAICAFDGVAENDSNKDENKKFENSKAKDSKTRAITESVGGAFVQYGLQMKNGKLQRGNVESLPIFYLSLKDEDYKSLAENLPNLNIDINAPISQNEKDVFSGFVMSLDKQYNSLRSTPGYLSRDVRKKLIRFEETLKVLRSCIN